MTNPSRSWLIAHLVWIIAVLAVPQAATAAPRPVIQDRLKPLPWGSVELGGVLGEKIALSIENRILAQDMEDLIKPFSVRQDTTHYRGEFWGKCMLALVDAWQYTRDPALKGRLKKKMDAALAGLLATQDPSGLITTAKPLDPPTGDIYVDGPMGFRLWDIWGRKYTLHGLVSCHQATGEARALEAARRLADFTIEEIRSRNISVVQIGNLQASSTIIEPMVYLYNLTGEQRYLDFAQTIVRDWQLPLPEAPDFVRKGIDRVPVGDRTPVPRPDERWYNRANGLQFYVVMASYEALAHLYRVTGDPEYLLAILNSFESIRESELMIGGSGSAKECWLHGRDHQLETETMNEPLESCMPMMVIKLANQILQLTGDSRVADQIEESFYNAYLGEMKTDGSWYTKHNPLAGVKKPGPDKLDMHQNCCVANGPRIMMMLPQIAVMSGREGPVINLYERVLGNSSTNCAKTGRF